MSDSIAIMFAINGIIQLLFYLLIIKNHESNQDFKTNQMEINKSLIKWMQEQERINKEIMGIARELERENRLIKKIILEQ